MTKQVTVPVDVLKVVFDAAAEADAAELTGKCTDDPCPFCTAMLHVQIALLDAEDA